MQNTQQNYNVCLSFIDTFFMKTTVAFKLYRVESKLLLEDSDGNGLPSSIVWS